MDGLARELSVPVSEVARHAHYVGHTRPPEAVSQTELGDVKIMSIHLIFFFGNFPFFQFCRSTFSSEVYAYGAGWKAEYSGEGVKSLLPYCIVEN